MNIDEIKRNLRNPKPQEFVAEAVTEPRKGSASAASSKASAASAASSKASSVNVNDDYGNLDSEGSEKEEKPNSKAWVKPENSRSTFYIEGEAPEVKKNVKSKKQPRIPQGVDSFISENELQNEVYNWSDSKLGKRGRKNFSEFLGSYFS
jgi:hypothetical protein